MRHGKHEWLSALASGFLTGIIFTAILCLAIKWFREGCFEWLIFKSAADGMQSLLDSVAV